MYASPWRVTHGEYADRTDRQTDGRTPDHYIMLSTTLGAACIIKNTCGTLRQVQMNGFRKATNVGRLKKRSQKE